MRRRAAAAAFGHGIPSSHSTQSLAVHLRRQVYARGVRGPAASTAVRVRNPALNAQRVGRLRTGNKPYKVQHVQQPIQAAATRSGSCKRDCRVFSGCHGGI